MSLVRLYNTDCLEKLKQAPDNSVDSLVTDPPAGISFMGSKWDSDKGGRDQWIMWMQEIMTECLRVLKPGAHGLVWALPRTSHWTATAIENAGFEVRDIITHIFGSGFPKNFNLGEGRGTALKPASEHWILIRKPIEEKTIAKNMLKYGTGGINIDASRIAGEKRNPGFRDEREYVGLEGGFHSGRKMDKDICAEIMSKGRFPANLVLSHHADCEPECHDQCAVAELDRQSGNKCGAAAPVKRFKPAAVLFDGGYTTVGDNGKSFRGDTGGASRFFYIAKASKSDKGADNTHPTVKSTKLMGYLIRMITPEGGIVLDPFMGSGSTGVAATNNGFGFVGIEQNIEYFEIAKNRIKKEDHDLL